MYPGLSHDEIIEECLKELKHHFEVGPEVALISAEKGVQCVPFDESLQKKFPYFEGTYEVFDADLYDSANFEAKKMIVNQLIRRVDVYRGYQINISFNFDLTPYIEGE